MPIDAEKMMKMCYYLDEKICRLTKVKPDKSVRLGKAIIFISALEMTLKSAGISDALRS